jgi:competence CoiA-like predicted nuclease
MAFQRTIVLAYDRDTGECYDATTSFKVAKEAYELRKRYNSGKLNLGCYRCDQPLLISDSKNDNVHFKHFPNADDCPLKNGKMSDEDVQDFTNIIRAHERPRHIFLKNRIAELLRQTAGVDPGSVIADTRYFFNDIEKRRPDVYGVYQGKEMAFEIQLSNLSQKYLIGRHNFYKQSGIYLVWILDNFNVYGQSTMERDIKYLTPSQNFFKLDEKAADFKLSCTYKSPFISEKDRVIAPWQTKSVSLSQVRFDPQSFQIYYLNYEQKLKETEQLLEEQIEAQRQEELKERKTAMREEAEQQVNAIVEKMKFYKNRNWNFYKFDEELNKLSYIGLEVLNERFRFADKRVQGKSLINHYITNAGDGQNSFIYYLLREDRIIFDCNISDDDGTTTLQHILKNGQLDYRQPLIKSLFKRGYQLTVADLRNHQALNLEEKEKEQELQIIKWCDQLKNKALVDDIYQHLTFLFAIETARKQQMIGFNYRDWISFGVQAILKHQQFYVYVERAFKRYGLWAIIEAHDKHKSFQKQIAKLQANPPEQDVTLVYPLMYELYHDIA